MAVLDSEVPDSEVLDSEVPDRGPRATGAEAATVGGRPAAGQR